MSVKLGSYFLSLFIDISLYFVFGFWEIRDRSLVFFSTPVEPSDLPQSIGRFFKSGSKDL